MNYSQITYRIKYLCKEKKISVAQMLIEIGLSKSFVYDIEKRETYPSCDKMCKIADYLEVSVDYLLGRTDEPEIKSISGNINNSNTVIGYNNKVSGNSIAYNVPERNDNLDKKSDNSTYSELLSYLETLSSSQRRHALADILDILEENYPL